MKVTIYQSITDTKNPFHIPIGTALQRIKSGKSKDIIEKIRDTGNKDYKISLPAVLFSGIFEERKDAGIKQHSGFIVLDIDDVIDPQEVKKTLSLDSYVYACWISPSGKGVKALVRINDSGRHREHFFAIEKYYEKNYMIEVDPTGKNISRACYESYDPELYLNEDSEVFTAFVSEEKKETKPKQEVVKPQEYTDYNKLNIAASMIRNAVDGEKHHALYNAARLCGGYIAGGRMIEEEAIRVLEYEISLRDIKDFDHAKRTIRDALNEGKGMPIHEVLTFEKTEQRKQRVKDGDMSFIAPTDEDFKWIADFADGKIELGLTTGSDTLDKYFRYKREFTILNGHSNVGKTTFCIFLMVNASIQHGWKWCVYSSENATASTKMRMMEFATDRKVDRMSKSELASAYTWVNKHFIFFSNRDMYSFHDILAFTDKVRESQKIDALFIDPYNSLKIDMGQHSKIGIHEYHYEAASELLNYSVNNELAIWLNTHAVTEAQRRKDGEGYPVAPYAEDSEHGGKWVNRCSCFLTIHRKVQHHDPIVRKTTEFHVRKVRVTETGGAPTPLYEPIEFQMNITNTGFYCTNDRGKRIFSPISEQFETYIPPSSAEDAFDMTNVI
jgi:hypothetical protein